MGFDKQANQDHCYLEGTDESVAMNVEISQLVVGDGYQVVYIENNHDMSDLDAVGGSGSKTEDGDDSQNSNNALVYLPYPEVCTEHEDLYLHEDEKLVKPGDKFSSHSEFVKYLNENAKRWCFYYKCLDSRNPNTTCETYTYNCVYLRNKEKYQKKGMRKRNNGTKTDCPCKIKLRRLPNEKELTVVYVCNHHDHELSLQEFFKLQHGRRLPPYVKEEIMDFLTLKVDLSKIKAYVAMETGFSMGRSFFYSLEKNMKSNNIERLITPERLAYLTQKISAVDLYDSNAQADEQAHDMSQELLVADNPEILKKIKDRRSQKGAERTRSTPQLKRRSKPNDASPDTSKKVKIENHGDADETYQSVQNVQDSVKCEIQPNPWVSDQCVPVLPNRTSVKTEEDESIHVQNIEALSELDPNAQNESGPFTYTIQYYNPEDNSIHEIICNEFGEVLTEEQLEVTGDITSESLCETVVSENDVNDQLQEQANVEQNAKVQEAETGNQNGNVTDETQNDSQGEDVNQSESLIQDLDSTQEESQTENQVQYQVEGNESAEGIQYVNEVDEASNAQDVGVQTANVSNSSQALMPVFDVYMKDGNVTGFVVNDNAIGGVKDGVDKEVQTSEEIMLSDLAELEDEIDGEIIHDKSGSTFIKHEYVHKYNIDKYMVQPHFPKYIQTLAKETNMDILGMFTNIYNEKAMFKLTTTQKEKVGNTRIWYVKDVRLKRHRKDDGTKEKLGKHLLSVFILKQKLKMMQRENNELMSKNKQLEELALKLVNLDD